MHEPTFPASFVIAELMPATMVRQLRSVPLHRRCGDRSGKLARRETLVALGTFVADGIVHHCNAPASVSKPNHKWVAFHGHGQLRAALHMLLQLLIHRCGSGLSARQTFVVRRLAQHWAELHGGERGRQRVRAQVGLSCALVESGAEKGLQLRVVEPHTDEHRSPCKLRKKVRAVRIRLSFEHEVFTLELARFF